MLSLSIGVCKNSLSLFLLPPAAQRNILEVIITPDCVRRTKERMMMGNRLQIGPISLLMLSTASVFFVLFHFVAIHCAEINFASCSSHAENVDWGMCIMKYFHGLECLFFAASKECLHTLDAKSIEHLIYINTYDTIAVEFIIIKGFSYDSNTFLLCGLCYPKWNKSKKVAYILNQRFSNGFGVKPEYFSMFLWCQYFSMQCVEDVAVTNSYYYRRKENRNSSESKKKHFFSSSTKRNSTLNWVHFVCKRCTRTPEMDSIGCLCWCSIELQIPLTVFKFECIHNTKLLDENWT